jgi:hypothetical protein
VFKLWKKVQKVLDRSVPENTYVTLGWDLYPTILNTDGTVFPRDYELIVRKEYYPKWPEETWPRNPKTGEKLEQTPVR